MEIIKKKKEIADRHPLGLHHAADPVLHQKVIKKNHNVLIKIYMLKYDYCGKIKSLTIRYAFWLKCIRFLRFSFLYQYFNYQLIVLFINIENEKEIEIHKKENSIQKKRQYRSNKDSSRSISPARSRDRRRSNSRQRRNTSRNRYRSRSRNRSRSPRRDNR